MKKKKRDNDRVDEAKEAEEEEVEEAA